MNKLFAWVLLSTAVPVFAATYTVKAGSSSSTIQATLNSAVAGSTISFQAGTYSLASLLIVPCTSNVTLTGPIASPATAIFLATYAGDPIMTLASCTGITIEYLGFDGGMPASGGGGGIYLGGPASNVTITHNNFYGNQAGSGNITAMSGIYFDGSQSTTDTNNVVTWNTFGASGNCSNVMNVQTDQGGYCSAALWGTSNSDLTVENNKVDYQEEGFKILPQLYCSNCIFENNDLSNIHRIGFELQVFTEHGPLSVEHNDFYNPVDPYYLTMAISTPCCFDNGKPPNSTISDNVLIANVAAYSAISPDLLYIPYGIEFWGLGSLAQYNLIQGYWGNGIVWGESTDAFIQYNTICGPDMASAGSYISNEEGLPAPTIAPNTTSASCAAVASTAPVVSTSGGVVTLTDSGKNHSIYYTTDGSTPTTASKLYTAPFSASGSTVKAIGMWGQGGNAAGYPAGYGYIPSAVVTASSAGIAAPQVMKKLASAYLGAKGGATTMVKGGTLQFTAYGVYSDGSVATMPDAQGNAVNLWNTSNHAVAKISSGGRATAMGAGKANVEATIGTVAASVWGVTVTAPAVAAEAAPVAAEVAPAAEAAPATELASAAAEAAPAMAMQPALAPATAAPIAQPAALAPQAPAASATEAAAAAPAYGAIPAAPGAPLSDNFPGPLWKLTAPAGGSASISNGHLFLGVPGGANHDPLLPTNQAVQVMQPVGNQSFDVSIKIDSPLVATDASTSQGLMVLSDNKNFVTFALVTEGTKIGLSAHMVTAGVATSVLNDTDFSQYQNPMYLRISRNGSSYVAFYSIDGTNWLQAASFNDTAVPTSIGPFAGNYNPTPAKAIPVVMAVNWFAVQ